MEDRKWGEMDGSPSSSLAPAVFPAPMACGCLVAVAEEKGERQSNGGIFTCSVSVEFPFSFLERELEALVSVLGWLREKR